MTTKEIITLQFGHYPNFVGTNWWNLQEAGFQYSPDETFVSEIDHDVLFREGLTSKNHVTFTPRLLLVDLKGSLKTLTKYGDLYEPIFEPNVSTVPWNEGAIEIKKEEKHVKNKFHEALGQDNLKLSSIRSKDIENDIDVWSDFLYSRYHPRTVNIINEFSHESADVPFDVYPLGKDLWKTSDFEEEFTDKIRNYLEECDSLQGFQICLDPTNAFGGFTTSCLEHLNDEYNKKSVLSFPIIPSHHSDYNITNSEDREKSTVKDSIRLVNLLLSLDAISDNSSLTVPLCTGTRGWRQPGPQRMFRHVNYQQESPYHTSAILATALETLTLPFRIKSNCFTIGDFCSDLNTHGRKIAAASLGFPIGMNSGEDLIDCLNKWEGPLLESLTPNCKIASDKTLQHITIRGVPLSRIKSKMSKTQRDMPAYRCESVKEMMEYYLSCTSFYTTSHVTAVNAALDVRMPYPDVFDEYVDIGGDISGRKRPADQSVKTVPAIAGCHSGAFVGNMIESLHRESGRIKLGRLHQFRTSGLEDDEYKECLNRILDLRDCYEENYDDL